MAIVVWSRIGRALLDSIIRHAYPLLIPEMVTAGLFLVAISPYYHKFRCSTPCLEGPAAYTALDLRPHIGWYGSGHA